MPRIHIVKTVTPSVRIWNRQRSKNVLHGGQDQSKLWGCLGILRSIIFLDVMLLYHKHFKRMYCPPLQIQTMQSVITEMIFIVTALRSQIQQNVCHTIMRTHALRLMASIVRWLYLVQHWALCFKASTCSVYLRYCIKFFSVPVANNLAMKWVRCSTITFISGTCGQWMVSNLSLDYNPCVYIILQLQSNVKSM